MEYILIPVAIIIAAIVIFLVLDYIVKKHKIPQTASDAIWKAIYFIQIKEYKQALELLEFAEKEYAIFPEEMCDLCIQRADAYCGLGDFSSAAQAYDQLFEVLGECEGKLKRNDALFKEIKECYINAGTEASIEKWEALFAPLEKGE